MRKSTEVGEDYASMTESQTSTGLRGSRGSRDKSILMMESAFMQQSKIPDHNLSLDTSKNCTLDSSCVTGSGTLYGCPSSSSFSSTGSPRSQLLPQSSSSSNNVKDLTVNEPSDDLRYKLRELETVMLGPNSDILDIYESNFKVKSDHVSTETEHWKLLMEMVSRRSLKEVLIACAKAVSDNDMLTAEWLMSELRQLVSVSGEPIQRLGAYMLEGLVARLAATGSTIYRTLRCKEPPCSDLSYMHLLYEVCPYFKFGYMSANGAIAEAMKDEDRIHIIDFQIAQGSQWLSLIQALAARPSGAPRIHITGIYEPSSTYARGGWLDIVGTRLSRLAESCNIPFEFTTATMIGPEAELKDLVLRPGEALAVNFPFMLHHVPDETNGVWNQRDGLLRLVKSLSPKVVTLVEQELDTNTAAFLPRFLETLDYYAAIFESIDVTLPRDHKERINLEQHCLARDLVNIIACEGTARVERHEVLGNWRSRFLMAGFRPYPLSPLVNATIKELLGNYCEHYKLEERDRTLYLGWMNRALVIACAWH